MWGNATGSLKTRPRFNDSASFRYDCIIFIGGVEIFRKSTKDQLVTPQSISSHDEEFKISAYYNCGIGIIRFWSWDWKFCNIHLCDSK